MPSSIELTRLTQALARTIAKVGGETVTYHVANHSVSVTATLGRSTFNVDDGTGATIQVTSHDFLIERADIKILGAITKPAAGHRIKRNVSGTINVYEVMTPPYSPAGSSDTWHRIHTKFIGTE